MDLQRARKELEAIVGQDDVVVDPAILADYARPIFHVVNPDRYINDLYNPPVVVRPESTAEVSKIVKLANRENLGIYVESGGSDTVGGSAVIRDGILLDLRKMSKIIEIDKENRYVVVQPGIRIQALQDELDPRGVTHGHRGPNFAIAAVGGVLSHYGVGGETSKYGLLADQVLGLEVVVGDGEILRIGAIDKCSMGQKNLLWMFLGTQGEHGVITEATIRLQPMFDQNRQWGHYGFDTFEAAMETSFELAKSGFRPTVQRVLGKAYMARTVPQLNEQGMAKVGGVMELCVDSPKEALAKLEMAEVDRICREHGGELVPTHVRERILEHRHQRVLIRPTLVGLEGGLWTSFLRYDAFRQMHTSMDEICARFGAVYGGSLLNAHPWTMQIWYRMAEPQAPGAADRLNSCSYAVIERALELGGTADSFHRPGLAYRHFAAPELGKGIDALRKLKAYLDPGAIMNAGKSY